MSISNPISINILAILLVGAGTISSLAQCKSIDAEAKVVQTVSDINSTKSIVIDFKNSKSDLFKISLFVPTKENILNSEKIEFNNLDSGKYIIVIVGKREEDNYCPKSINVTIN